MSIKIISNSMIDPIKCECPNCKSVFTYTYEDIQRREENNYFGTSYTKRFVICPVCKFDISLQRTQLFIKADEEETVAKIKEKINDLNSNPLQVYLYSEKNEIDGRSYSGY